MMSNKIQTDSVRSDTKKSKILGSHDCRILPRMGSTGENISTNGASIDYASANGNSTNGASTNGTFINGTSTNRTSANGASADHTSANGTSADHTSANGASTNHGSVSRKSVLIAGLILLLLALHIGAVLCYSAVSGSGQDSLQLRLEASPLTAEAVKQLTEGKELNAKLEETAPADVPLYTAWTQKNEMTLQNLRLGRKSTADVIFYTGDNNSRFNLTLDNGCAITDEMAFQLWGVGRGTEILGSSLRIGGQDYIVEQILPSGKRTKGWTGGTVLARYQDGSDSSHSPIGPDSITFDVLEIHSPSGQLVSSEEIIAAGNLKNAFPLDFRQLQSMLAALRVLPIWCGAFFLAVFWISTAARKRAEAFSKVQEEGKGITAKWQPLLGTAAKWQHFLGIAGKWRGIPWLGGILLIALTGFLFGFPFLIPQSSIPTRWSDFSFWGAKLEAAGEWFHKLATMAYYGPDVYFRQEAVGMVLCCAGEGILVCVLLRLLFSQDRRHGLSYR